MRESGTVMIVPSGTQIVTRVAVTPTGGGRAHPAGAVAVIVRSPADATHSYRVRFHDGTEAVLRRDEFTGLKQEQRERIGLPARGAASSAALPHDSDLRRYVIYRCVVGSRAYGLEGEESDIDRRGMYLPPAERHWSLVGVPEQLEDDAAQECFWEVQKFLVLALKANPNVLECLYAEQVEYAHPLASQFLEQRDKFLSKLVYQTYNGYVMSQFRKLEQDLRNRGQIKWKHAMHLIRLLLAGITTLREGFVPLKVTDHRERLLTIKRGEVEWRDVNAWRLALHADFEQAFIHTKLPERPDYAAADAFLMHARRRASQPDWSGE